MKKAKAKKLKVKKVAIKDLPTRAAKDEAIRGGAEPINDRKIRNL